MKDSAIYKFYKSLSKDRFSLVYLGEFNDKLTYEFLLLNKASGGESNTVKKRVFFLMNECYQNIIRHADKNDAKAMGVEMPMMFMVRNINDAFYIGSSNIVENKIRENLSAKFESVNSYTVEELEDVYKNSLVNNSLSEKGGAGVGLIEMARKTNYPLEYAFDPVNDRFSVFHMQLILNLSNTRMDVSQNQAGIDAMKSLYREMVDEHVIMIQKGDFSQDAILPLLDIVTSNLDSIKNVGARKKIIYILIEMLQNISRHGSELEGSKEGIFAVLYKDNKYHVMTGNFVENTRISRISDHIDKVILRAGENKLDELYTETILKLENNGKGSGAGVGFMEILKFGGKEFKYMFEPVKGKDVSFFSLSIAI
ncbi:MAG TPA: SiaB family protein kinase [Bacteroidia bacterium]|nr:SiaB family protein kinase [Bacteroidia bacterium]